MNFVAGELHLEYVQSKYFTGPGI